MVAARARSIVPAVATLAGIGAVLDGPGKGADPKIGRLREAIGGRLVPEIAPGESDRKQIARAAVIIGVTINTRRSRRWPGGLRSALFRILRSSKT